jgi:hypothetical protein
VSGWFEELEPIAEGVVDIEPSESWQWLIVDDLYTGIGQALSETGDIVDQECRMRLAGGSEFLLDPKVDAHTLRLEPTPTANHEMTWLGNLRDAQKLLVELDGLILATLGHRQLHVIKITNCHRRLISSDPRDTVRGEDKFLRGS